MKNRLFLLDAMALIYRAHFAFSRNPLINSKGVNTGVVRGFTSTLWQLLKKEKPTHIAVAFDTPEPTFRHVNFPAYKAQREAQPEDITTAIPTVFDMLKAFNITTLKLGGFEADDIIGTIATQVGKMPDFEVFMLTPDKDYSQIVTNNVFLYKPSFTGNDYEVWGVPEVLKRWDIKRVEQVIDVLGLQGDAVDNIPGIPGVGEKTAIKLLQEFDNIENIIANADKLKGKLQESVKTYADQARLSRELATIDINVPLTYHIDDFALKPMNELEVLALFDELEFKTLKAEIFSKTISKSPTQQKDDSKPKTTKKPNSKATTQPDLFATSVAVDADSDSEEMVDNSPAYYRHLGDTPHHYHVIDSPALRAELIELLGRQEAYAVDTETTSLDTLVAELVGIAFSCKVGEAYYVPFPADRTEAQNLANEFKSLLENPNIIKVGQNIKYDFAVFQNYGIELAQPFFDTMLAHYLLNPDSRHNLDALAENYLQYSTVHIDELIGKKAVKNKTDGAMKKVALAEIKEYAGEDADVTWQLYKLFDKKFDNLSPTLSKLERESKNGSALSKLERESNSPLQNGGGQGGRFILTHIETPLIPVLAYMERAGVKIDKDNLKDISDTLVTEILAIEKNIYTEAGEQFNIGSPKQLGDILFDKLKLDDKAKKTKTGQYATGEEILSKLLDKHAIVPMILEYRELVKLKNTYIDALPALIHPQTGRVHSSFQQAVASTGRLSSINPNLQNIPIRTAKGREIRKAFVAESQDFVILSADYSQIELRIMAHFSQDATMIEAFQKNLDIHTATASKIFKVSLDEVDSDMRRKAKTANFGIIYGISAHGLSQRLNIPRKEAGEIIQAYFEEFPAIKKYMDNVAEQARKTEYVETLLGRRRYLRNINASNAVDRAFAERNAINAPIQGSAADMIKLAMIKVHDFIQKNNLKSRMVLQVHDELVFEAHKSELDLLQTAIADCMKTAMPLIVPIEVGMGFGDNWLEAH
jgi:DNA polymerase-1